MPSATEQSKKEGQLNRAERSRYMAATASSQAKDVPSTSGSLSDTNQTVSNSNDSFMTDRVAGPPAGQKRPKKREEGTAQGNGAFRTTGPAASNTSAMKAPSSAAGASKDMSSSKTQLTKKTKRKIEDEGALRKKKKSKIDHVEDDRSAPNIFKRKLEEDEEEEDHPKPARKKGKTDDKLSYGDILTEETIQVAIKEFPVGYLLSDHKKYMKDTKNGNETLTKASIGGYEELAGELWLELYGIKEKYKNEHDRMAKPQDNTYIAEAPQASKRASNKGYYFKDVCKIATEQIHAWKIASEKAAKKKTAEKETAPQAAPGNSISDQLEISEVNGQEEGIMMKIQKESTGVKSQEKEIPEVQVQKESNEQKAQNGDLEKQREEAFIARREIEKPVELDEDNNAVEIISLKKQLKEKDVIIQKQAEELEVLRASAVAQPPAKSFYSEADISLSKIDNTSISKSVESSKNDVQAIIDQNSAEIKASEESTGAKPLSSENLSDVAKYVEENFNIDLDSENEEVASLKKLNGMNILCFSEYVNELKANPTEWNKRTLSLLEDAIKGRVSGLDLNMVHLEPKGIPTHKVECLTELFKQWVEEKAPEAFDDLDPEHLEGIHIKLDWVDTIPPVATQEDMEEEEGIEVVTQVVDPNFKPIDVNKLPLGVKAIYEEKMAQGKRYSPPYLRHLVKVWAMQVKNEEAREQWRAERQAESYYDEDSEEEGEIEDESDDEDDHDDPHEVPHPKFHAGRRVVIDSDSNFDEEEDYEKPQEDDEVEEDGEDEGFTMNLAQPFGDDEGSERDDESDEE